ncbi:MAG: hypothetical protein O8C63_05530 [Candidatus Methanoperedens sp.]|nr:hypothetical protein [Candidatus Methanoperedens sp.]
MENVVDYYVLDTEDSPNTDLSISRRDLSNTEITVLSRIEMFGAGGTGNNDDLKGVLAFSTNNTGIRVSRPEERMRIHTNGYVGIGTDNPKTPLHIPGQGLQIGTSPQASNNFHMVSDFTENSRGFRLFNGNYEAGTHLLTVLVDGRVGIGTPTPSAKLEVNGDAKFNDTVTFAGSNPINIDQYGIRQNSANPVLAASTDTTYIRSPSNNGNIGFQSNDGGNTSLLINTLNGNVGIGTPNPGAKLSINGGLHVGGELDPGDDNLLVDGKVTANQGFFGNGVGITGVAPEIHRHSADQIDTGTITGNFQVTGNVGIGAKGFSEGIKLEVNGIIKSSGIKLGNIEINNFSNDSELLNDISSSTVPTQNAVKNYVDNKFAGILETVSDTTFIRSPTNDGYIKFQSFCKKTALVIDTSSGNVGIGTTPTTGKLQFTNDLGNKIVFWDGEDADRYGIGLNSGNLNAFIPVSARFSIRNNGFVGAEQFIVTGTGKVGIGRVDKLSTLTIRGIAPFTIGEVKNSMGYIKSEGKNFETQVGIGDRFSITTNEEIYEGTVVKIENNKLEVLGGTMRGEKIGDMTVLPSLFRVENSYEVTQFVISDRGFVGIGTKNPISRLDVWGDIRITGNLIGSIWDGNLNVNGDVTAEKFFSGGKEVIGSEWSKDYNRISYDKGDVIISPGKLLAKEIQVDSNLTVKGRIKRDGDDALMIVGVSQGFNNMESSDEWREDPIWGKNTNEYILLTCQAWDEKKRRWGNSYIKLSLSYR